MRLREIEVRHWRGLDQRKLGGLADGLNLVLGPNESGKSRLFQGLRFAFFEGHKGNAQHKVDLQSWAGTESPFTRVAFEVDGTEYEVQKQFLRGGFATLTGGGATLRGDDAEDRLRQLLGTQAGNSRGVQVADMGVWPMLMVGQGDSREAVHGHMNEAGRATLHKRLSSEIGVAAIGAGGQKLLDLVEREFTRYFTATGQLGTVIRDARTRLANAQQTLEQAKAALAGQERIATELASARNDFAGLAPRLQKLEADALEAGQRAQQCAQLRGRIEHLQTERKLAQANVTAAELEVTRREGFEKAAQQAAKDALERRAQADEAALAGTDLERAVALANEAVGTAQLALDQARAAVVAARNTKRHADLTRQQQALRNQIQRLSAFDGEVSAIQTALAGMPAVDSTDVKRLRALAETVSTARASLHGAAVSLSIVLKQPSTIDGVGYAQGQTVAVEVVDDRSIELGDFATILVRPGGGEIVGLRSAVEAADAALSAALSKLGVPSFEEAASVSERRSNHMQRLQQIDELRKNVSSRTAAELGDDLRGVESELAGLGAVEPDGLGESEAADAERAGQQTYDDAVQTRDGAREALREHQTRLIELRGQVQYLETLHRAAVATVDGCRPAAELEQVAAQAREALRQIKQQQLDADRAYADAGGDQVAAIAVQATQAVETMRQRVRDQRSRVDRLEGELQAILAAAPFESVQDAESELALAEASAARIERESAAVMLLRTTIVAERKKVVEQLIAPVIQKIRPYLHDLFPGSQIDAGENLQFEGLHTGNVKEPFEQLSGGAQEQVSLLTRIGLAEVLAGGGALPLVLDDALINTDPKRIARIQRALFRAAQNGIQVLLFSCHDLLFDSFGADRVYELPGTRI